MKTRALEKLSRRLSKPPLVHIDASAVLEKETTDDGYRCKKFLNMVGYRCRGRFSLVVLGEMF